MLLRWFFLFLMPLPLCLQAQQRDSVYKQQLKASFYRLIDVINPSIELSYEREHGKRFSTQVAIAYPTNIIGKTYYRLVGYRLGVEEKYFTHRGERPGRYLALSLDYNNIRFDETTPFLDSVNNITYTDTFTVHRQITTLNVAVGRQLYYRRFIFDAQMGIGVKYRHVRHKDREGEFLWPEEPFQIHKSLQEERDDFAPNLLLNIRMGYRF
jgi:hypothetical protein